MSGKDTGHILCRIEGLLTVNTPIGRKLRDGTAAHRKNPQRGLNSVGVESGNHYLDFKTGTDVGTWARNRYEPLASLVWSLSEGQMDAAQHLVDGMLQELKVANLFKFADQVASRRDRNFHPAF